MTREARANLIFLCVLAVLVTPGFLILMHRKLTGSSRPNDLPDPVPTAIAYMQPLPAPPLPRREPKLVRDWVRQLLQALAGTGVRVMRDGEGAAAGPLVSDRFVTQLAGLSAAAADGSIGVSLIRWDDRSDLATDTPVVSADLGGRSVDAKINRLDSIKVPRDVRHALQDVGYVTPPLRVWWIAATLPTTAGDPAPRALSIRYRETSKQKTETIPLTPAAAPARIAASPTTRPAPEPHS